MLVREPDWPGIARTLPLLTLTVTVPTYWRKPPDPLLLCLARQRSSGSGATLALEGGRVDQCRLGVAGLRQAHTSGPLGDHRVDADQALALLRGYRQARASQHQVNQGRDRFRRGCRLAHAGSASFAMSGIVRCQSVICWYASATANTVGSSNGRPTTCMPTGSPSDEKPQGIEMAGRPVRF